MRVTEEFLKPLNPCKEGYKYAIDKGYIGLEGVDFVKKLISDDKLEWANWLIVRIIDYKEYVSYAVFAALQVIDIYEKQCPDDKRPRLAIEAAQRCIDNPSDENKAAARAAAAWA